MVTHIEGGTQAEGVREQGQKRIIDPQMDEGTGEWKTLHNEELNDLYFSSIFVRVIKQRRMSQARRVARMGDSRGVYRLLMRKSEGKRPFGRTILRWENNKNMNLQEVGSEGMEWIELALYRDKRRALLNAVMSLRVP